MGDKREGGRTGGKARRLRASTVLRTFEMLCWLTAASMIVACVGFGRVLGLNWMTATSCAAFVCSLAAKALGRQAALAGAERETRGK